MKTEEQYQKSREQSGIVGGFCILSILIFFVGVGLGWLVAQLIDKLK